MKTLLYLMHACACGWLLSTGNYIAAVWCALATWHMYMHDIQTTNFTTVINAYRGLVEAIEKVGKE